MIKRNRPYIWPANGCNVQVTDVIRRIIDFLCSVVCFDEFVIHSEYARFILNHILNEQRPGSFHTEPLEEHSPDRERTLMSLWICRCLILKKILNKKGQLVAQDLAC